MNTPPASGGAGLRVTSAPSPNFNEREAPLDMLVLHYTGMVDGPSALARLRDPAAGVSAHYVVEEDGEIFALVAEDKRAWHAGRGWWRGRTDINSRSIGIEVVNGGHDFGLPPFAEPQVQTVITLCKDILARWGIPQAGIVGHSDIAPDRKCDPGERFPWRRLAAAGIGVWPSADLQAGPAEAEPRAALAAIGYAVAAYAEHDVAAAFQRRWRPDSITGEMDPETCRLAAAVAALLQTD